MDILVAWINERVIPVVDPEDIKALRNLSQVEPGNDFSASTR
jgi:hypothetical protein